MTNKQKTLSAIHQDPIKPNQPESQYMLAEMKTLLKQNTSLKQENLILKQQIMLAKIEIQNLSLKLEQALADTHKKSVPSSARPLVLEDDLQLKLDVKSYQRSLEKQSKPKTSLTLKAFISKELPQSQNKLPLQTTSKRKPLIQLTQTMITTNPTEKVAGKDIDQSYRTTCNSFRSARGELAKRQPQIEGKENGAQSKKMSRKQQIMNKYRPYIQTSDCHIGFKGENYFIK